MPENSTTMYTAKPPIAKAQFVERINKRCRKTWEIVRRNWADFVAVESKKGKGGKTLFAEAVRLPLLSGIVFYIFDAIRQLGAPAGDEQEIEAMIGPFQIAVELGWKKRWRAYSTEEVISHFSAYNARALRYGLDDCLVTASNLGELRA